MQKQTFVVTLEVFPPFDGQFPRVEARRMADIIRDGVEAKSYSFIGAIPFKISVERVDEEAIAAGKIKEDSSEELAETGLTTQAPVRTLDVTVVPR